MCQCFHTLQSHCLAVYEWFGDMISDVLCNEVHVVPGVTNFDCCEDSFILLSPRIHRIDSAGDDTSLPVAVSKRLGKVCLVAMEKRHDPAVVSGY
jgi:hypothetical protein